MRKIRNLLGTVSPFTFALVMEMHVRLSLTEIAANVLIKWAHHRRSFELVSRYVHLNIH